MQHVLSWRLLNALDADLCVEVLDEAILRFGSPKIFNMDQGSQFTSFKWMDTLRKAEGYKSPWTVWAGSWITSSLKGFGVPSNMSVFSCMLGAADGQPKSGLVNG